MKRILPFLWVFLLLTGCAPREVQQQFFAMDTAMLFTAYGDAASDALRDAQQEIFRLDALLSRTRVDSDVSRLNAAAGADAVDLSADTAALLRRADALSAATGGTFDPTVAPVMDAWGFGGEAYRVPSADKLAALLPLVGVSALEVDAAAPRARLAQPGMAVDLGGIAKGYAADRVVTLLKDAGVTSALLSLGTSTVAAVGDKPDGSPWRVGVRSPVAGEGHVCVIDLHERTLSTSGAYERFFEEDGQIYHHILDPKTGAPARSDLLSVTVVSTDGALTDALSTALFIVGSDGAIDLWRSQAGWDLVLIRADHTILVTQGLEDSFALGGEEAGYRVEIIRR